MWALYVPSYFIKVCLPKNFKWFLSLKAVQDIGGESWVETPLTPAKGYCREGRVRGPGNKASPLPSRRTWGITLLKASLNRAPNGIIQNKRLLWPFAIREQRTQAFQLLFLKAVGKCQLSVKSEQRTDILAGEIWAMTSHLRCSCGKNEERLPGARLRKYFTKETA